VEAPAARRRPGGGRGSRRVAAVRGQRSRGHGSRRRGRCERRHLEPGPRQEPRDADKAAPDRGAAARSLGL